MASDCSGSSIGDAKSCRSIDHQKRKDKERHLKLAAVVKGVHAKLRKEFKQKDGDFQTIWEDHCQNNQLLEEYAEAMHLLATDHWSKNPETRIHWCHNICKEYFLENGLQRALEKDLRRKMHQVVENKETIEDRCGAGDNINQAGEEPMRRDAVNGIRDNGEDAGLDSNSIPNNEERKAILEKYSASTNYTTIKLPFLGKMRLLDVGSCYNPFLEFEEFVAIGIDISPAVETVYHCDFLHLETTEPLQLATDTIDTYINNLSSPIERLPREAFHVVVFSLLLEYFPSAYQRWLCCQRAHQLLMVNGLLVVITPDSGHQNKNAPMMKSWKTAIESLGFRRWRYEKMEHLHCMAFRKISVEDAGNGFVGEANPDMLFIPQDYNNSGLEKDGQLFDYTQEDEDFTRGFLAEMSGLEDLY